MTQESERSNSRRGPPVKRPPARKPGIRSQVGLADVARCFKRLAPRGKPTRAAVALLLGFEWRTHAVPAVRKRPPKRVLEEPPTEPISDPDAGADPEGETVPSTTRSDAIERVLEPVTTEREGLSRPWEVEDVLEEVEERHLEGVAAFEPLFGRRSTPGILAACSATPTAAGPVDVEALVSRVASARPVVEIPRLRRPTLATGVQLLIDAGAGMEPFARDQIELAEELRRVAGRSQVEQLSFADCPLRGAGEGPFWTWERYRPPVPGRPVLVLTDLGIGGPPLHLERAAIREWLAFAELLRRQESPLVVLVPYKPERWPKALERAAILVHWDRGTTLAAVRDRIRGMR